MIDRPGSDRAVAAGLVAVMSGTLLMTVLPGRFAVGGDLASLAIVTFGYGLFQAANTTAAMQSTSTIRAVAGRHIELVAQPGAIWGASAMGVIYAIRPRVFKAVGLLSEIKAALHVTFAVATGLAAFALAGLRGVVVVNDRSDNVCMNAETTGP